MKSKVIVSMDITAFLAKFCSVPVKKACGKKNPDIQKACRCTCTYTDTLSMLYVRSITVHMEDFTNNEIMNINVKS